MAKVTFRWWDSTVIIVFAVLMVTGTTRGGFLPVLVLVERVPADTQELLELVHRLW
ncbi:hypothetical protein M3226_16455 [Neobacillus cucumis]|uniref:hypothetical protein n=1 Tax=Neobacillus cucumis TaxID=1740721 RepID=UPI00204223F6|nr:hypothetical protein [Neobacillus cucumis]MCM3727271.1 hypothetical protein [Neobacillus cucumis]